MKVLVAPNSLKGSLDAFTVADAIERGLRRGWPELDIDKLVIADGGDATADVLTRAAGGTLKSASASDPLGRRITACWGLLPDGTAVIDVAAASGISLLEPQERDPAIASSYGTGELIVAALDQSCRRILLGVGGSATVDAGAGILEALGARLLDAEGRPLPRGGGALRRLHRIELGALDARIRDTKLVILCDVTNPLLGRDGAAQSFAPQKGADAALVGELEAGLARLADVLQEQFQKDVRSMRHGGAAGGIPATLYATLDAELVFGIDFVLDALNFEAHIVGSDLVITAEGLLDRQTLGHKGPFGVARAAKRHGVPVVALAGGLQEGLTVEELGVIDAMFSIVPRPMSLETAMRNAETLVSDTAEQIARSLRLFCRGDVSSSVL